MKRDPEASDSLRLVYREKAYPIFGIPLLAFGLFLIIQSICSYFLRLLHGMPLFGEHGFGAHWGGWIFEFIIVSIGWWASTSRRLVFDRRRRTLTRTTGFFSWGFSSTYAFDEFDSVACNSHTTSSEHGSSTTYSVVLAGPWKEVELFDTPAQAVAQSCTSEIAAFLRIELKQGKSTGAIPLSARASLWALRVFIIGWGLMGSFLVLCAVVFLASSIFELLTGERETGDVLCIVATLLIFLTVVGGIFVFGAVLLRKSLKEMKEEASRERATLAAAKRAASSTSSPSGSPREGERSPGSRARPDAMAQRIALFAKLGAGAIPIVLFVYFAWNVFPHNEPPKVEKPARDNEQAEITRKWEETLRAQEEILASSESEAVWYDVCLRGKQGQEIQGQVDTAHNTFVIRSWSDPQKKLWAPLPEEFPITLYAFRADGELYDVPDNWNGKLEKWMFLLPPVEDTASVRWDGGTVQRAGDSFGWGGFRSRSGKICTWGTESFQYVPYMAGGRSEIIFDLVTISPEAVGE